MNLTLELFALTLLVAVSQAAGPARAQAPIAPSAPAVQPAASPATAPEGWINYDKITYTPVVDDVSRHLEAARKALDAKDNPKAAAELRAAAEELKAQAARADDESRSVANEDREQLAAARLDRDTSRRLSVAARKVSSVAAAVDSGKITTEAGFDSAIDNAARADIERRWLVADVTTWYQASKEPHRHFTGAAAAYARKDYKAAATDIRKAVSYLRLEANRATGAAKRDLDSSVAQLDRLADSAEKGALKDEHAMAANFAKAEHALALEHRANAIDSWALGQFDQAGYELKASANSLENAAGWIGGEMKAGASTTAADARVVGDKLVSGVTWTRHEIACAFDTLGNGVNAVGKKIGDARKAALFDVRA